MINVKEYSPSEVVFSITSSPFTFLTDLITPLCEDQSVKRNIVLFGGSTAIAFYKFLLENSADKMVNFKNINFWFTDERMVDVNDPESNYGQFRKHFLKNDPDIPEENFHPMRGVASGSFEEMEAEMLRLDAETREFVPADPDGVPSFDLVILGLGNDGHTASLFPKQFNFDDESLYVPASHPETFEKRISMSLKLINAAQKVAVVATGASKEKTIAEVVGSLLAQNKLRRKLFAEFKEGKLEQEQLASKLKEAALAVKSPVALLESPHVYCVFDHDAGASLQLSVK